MSTKSLNILILIIISTYTTYAQKIENALLWEISGNGIEEPSYIFGILKFIPADDYYFPSIADNKLKKCNTLVTETELDHHARHELNKAAHLDNHQGLDDFLSKEDYEKLAGIFENKLSINDYKFNVVYKKFKPIMLSTTMTRLSLGDNVKYYELELINKANTLGLSTEALEHVENEVEALNMIKLDDQLTSLKHTIENFDKQLADYKELVQYFKKGDLHNTLEYTMHPIENHSDYEKHFVYGRNQQWIPKIESLVKEKPTFFAIGASHLSEEKGIINLLIQKGYTLTPVK